MPVAVAAVDRIAMGVVVIAGALVDVVVIVRVGMDVHMGMPVLVGMSVGMRMGMDEIAVAVLVGMDMGVRMGMAVLVDVFVRLVVIVAVDPRLVVHHSPPPYSLGRGARPH